jgi:hypothetical protein
VRVYMFSDSLRAVLLANLPAEMPVSAGVYLSSQHYRELVAAARRSDTVRVQAASSKPSYLVREFKTLTAPDASPILGKDG